MEVRDVRACRFSFPAQCALLHVIAPASSGFEIDPAAVATTHLWVARLGHPWPVRARVSLIGAAPKDIEPPGQRDGGHDRQMQTA